MNKAFVREPDDTGDLRCPRCGSLGISVGAATLDAQLPANVRAGVANSAFFCPFPTCEAVYFDMFDRVIEATAVGRAIYPKDPEAPLCGCFGLTADDIEQDLREGAPTRVKSLLAQAKSPAAQCEIKSPTGQCCLPDVQKYYLQRRQKGE